MGARIRHCIEGWRRSFSERSARLFRNAPWPAATHPVPPQFFSGTDPADPDHFYVYLETIAGGSGAQRGNDGLSGVQVHMTNTSNLPIEALEMEFPLLIVHKYGLIENSGGAGEYRGGLGIERIFEAMYDNINYTGLGDRQVYKPWARWRWRSRR